MSSPSEFLTFYRRAVISTPRILRVAQLNARPAVRTFAASSRRGDKSTITEKSNEHSTDKAKKGNDYDVGSSNVKAGMDSTHKSGSGGHATERKDSAGAKAKAKKEFPEAPDPAIGMQDERGGRGA